MLCFDGSVFAFPGGSRIDETINEITKAVFLMGLSSPVPAVSRVPDAPLRFRCNICDANNVARLKSLTREDPTCLRCGSPVRWRSIIQILTTELFGRSLRISQIAPKRPDLVGLGLSCPDGYAIPLARKLGYTNTFFHQAPRLDITRIDASREGKLDFLIASDVFEHIESPVSRGFENVSRLLKPDGVFIFSVPFTHPGESGIPTTEHFPDLHDYRIEKIGEKHVLRNTSRDGKSTEFDQLVFHGGPGSTLEMRVFSEASIFSELEKAGFQSISVYSGSDLDHGIFWPDKWSVPMAARKQVRAESANPSMPSSGPEGRTPRQLSNFLGKFFTDRS